MICLIPSSLNLLELSIPQLEKWQFHGPAAKSSGVPFIQMLSVMDKHRDCLWGSPGGTRAASVELIVKAQDKRTEDTVELVWGSSGLRPMLPQASGVAFMAGPIQLKEWWTSPLSPETVKHWLSDLQMGSCWLDWKQLYFLMLEWNT